MRARRWRSRRRRSIDAYIPWSGLSTKPQRTLRAQRVEVSCPPMGLRRLYFCLLLYRSSLELFIKIFCRRVMLWREAKHSSARTPTLQKMCRCSGAVPGAEDKKNAAQRAAGLQGSGRGERFIEVVGLVGFECAAAHLRPTACRRGDRSTRGADPESPGLCRS